MGLTLAILGFLVVVTLLIVLRALTAFSPAPREVEYAVCRGPEPPPAGLELTVVTWNLGYAGLGRNADFIADGGRRLRAASQQEILDNYQGLSRQLAAESVDVMMLQELARDNFLTRGVDLLRRLSADLDAPRATFTPTVRVTGLPVVGNLVVGKGTFSWRQTGDGTRFGLPTARDLGPLTMQHFNVLETRFPVTDQPWEWVLLNVHLSAFDDGSLRTAQLAAVIERMQQEYLAGNRVVAGGDWNLLLTAVEFPHTTSEADKFWVRPMPADVVPEGWSWGFDDRVATCRTLERPYQAGVNYTCVIDGFLTTPNVDITSVETIDLGFMNSDHQPVRIRLQTTPDPR